METTLLERMGVAGCEFWRLTPAETDALLEGANKRREEAWERAAMVCQYVVSPWVGKGKKPPSIDEILGREAETLSDTATRIDGRTAQILREKHGIETQKEPE